MVSDQNYFSSSLFLQRDLPNDDENYVNISRKQKVKQIRIKGKYAYHPQNRKKLVHELCINKDCS